MRLLFDQGAPDPLRHHIAGHTVETCDDRGWSRVKNGDLLRAAEQDGFEVFLTTDQSLKYQQNLTGRKLAIIVLLSTSWPKIQNRIQEIQDAVDHAKPGDYIEIQI
jgi:hypothetical protein